MATEAITIWPSWIWAVPGLLMVLDRRQLWRHARWPLLAWSVLAIGFSEVWRIVLLPRGEPGEVRVVTLNTGGDMMGAMREVAELDPDIVLLQESAMLPSEEKAVAQVFGPGHEVIVGVDASVIVRGRIVGSELPTTNHTFVRAELEGGRAIEIVSLRMMAPIARLDYWRKDCWQGYARHRERHLDELAEIWRSVQRMKSDAPLVFGGDFNLVPDKGEQEVLGDELTDSFLAAGRGWYATALSETPFFRIDKVWSSRELRALGTSSHRSRVSDHRYVVADFDWAD